MGLNAHSMRQPSHFPKLTAYLGTATALMQSGGVGAQIVYTDFQPDVVLDMNPFVQWDVDVDGDGTSDISIYGNYFLSSWNYTYTTSYGSVFTSSYFRSYRYWRLKGRNQLTDRMLVNNSPTWWQLMPFQLGDTVGPHVASGSSLVWASSGDAFYNNSLGQSTGAWTPGGGDLFVGIRLERNSSYYYGWLRMEQIGGAPAGQLVLKDMAIDTAAMPILAGDTATSNNSTRLNENWRNLHQVWQRHGQLLIKTEAGFGPFELNIYDAKGTTLHRSLQGPGQVIELPLTHPAGWIMVQFRGERGVLNRKVLWR